MAVILKVHIFTVSLKFTEPMISVFTGPAARTQKAFKATLMAKGTRHLSLYINNATRGSYSVQKIHTVVQQALVQE